MTAMLGSAVWFFSIFSLLESAYARQLAAALTKATASSAGRANLTAPLGKEMMYTTNSLCRQNYCTNPIFPGINDLPRLEALQWQCSTTSMVHQHMDFCKDAVAYDPALPSPVSKATPVNELVKAQEDAAMTMFVYHLSGMGYEAWDFQNPSQSDNDCVRSVWKMVCFTYFPRAEAGCAHGQQSSYKRPCKSSCQNYLQQCGIECCDESVQCVFAHTGNSPTGQVQLLQTGYVDELGPSAMCTGSSRHSMSSPLLVLLVVFMALWLQGCDMEVPQHAVGNWRSKTNYLNQYKYLPAGKNANSAVLNSCSQKDAPATLQCNGRGYCRSFSTSGITTAMSNPVSFCQCNLDWADPECGTKRKSQMSAFFWSLFLGFAGADYFYLGFPLWGVVKLFTLGGFGFWWLIDIVRIAAGPVYAYNYRTANDLPHWVAMLILISVFLLIGFLAAIEGFLVYRRAKREDLGRLQQSEEARLWKNTQEELAGYDGPRYRNKGVNNFDGRPGFSGYGATLPVPHPNGNAPYASFGPESGMPFAGPFGPAGIVGQGSPTPASLNTAAPLNMGFSL